jgi:hypothetical protein
MISFYPESHGRNTHLSWKLNHNPNGTLALKEMYRVAVNRIASSTASASAPCLKSHAMRYIGVRSLSSMNTPLTRIETSAILERRQTQAQYTPCGRERHAITAAAV